jgi:vitamin B12 transporter
MKRNTSLPAVLLGCTAGLCASATLSADTPTPRMEEIVVTSSRVAMPLRQVGTSLSVITAQEIERRGFNSLFDILRTQPGIAVSNQGGQGKITALRIRGEESYRTRLFIDGIDVADTSAPQTTPRLDQLMSAGIDRVEILRGPQGLMYGADAGGVINVATAPPGEGLSGAVNAEGGRYGTRQIGGSIAGGSKKVEVSLFATDFETDGFNAKDTDTTLRDDDGYDNTTFHGRLRWNITDQLGLEVIGRDVEGENEYDGCNTVNDFIPTDDCVGNYEQQAYRVATDYEIGRFGHELSYNYSDNQSRDDYAGERGYSAEGKIETIGYVGTLTASESMSFVYGAELRNEYIDDGSTDSDRDQEGYFLEYQGGFNDSLFVTAGLRYDDNDDFGDYTSYRASAAYLIDLASGELKFKGTYGTGFRAPSLYEIAYNGGAFSFPPASDVNLGEEESEGYDIGVVYAGASGLYLEANYFDQTINDEIYFDLDNFSGYLQGNGDSQSNGVELIAESPLPLNFSVAANYTYNDTETADGDTRIRRPEHLANLGLNWSGLNDQLILGLNVRLSRDALSSRGAELDDYEVLDFNASYEILDGLRVYGRVENLLNEDYQEVASYKTSGAAGYAGLRYQF